MLKMKELIVRENKAFEQMCKHIAVGGSAVDLCKIWGVDWSDFIEWVNDNDDRAKQLLKAHQFQVQYAIDLLVKELQLIATLDTGDAYDKNGNLKNMADMPANVRKAISSVDTFEEFEGFGQERECIGLTKKVKFFDKMKALELLGRKFAAFVDRTRVDVESETLEDLIHKSMQPEVVEVEKVDDAHIIEEGTPYPGGTGGVE